MASQSTVDKTSLLSISRSAIQRSIESVRSDELQLSTEIGMRDFSNGIVEDISTSDVPALPFVVCHSIIQGDPARSDFYHLFPGDFPLIEDDIGHGASFIVQKANLRAKKSRSGEDVAVALKRIRPSSSKTRQSFRGVISDLICLVHPILRQSENIITLLGLGWETCPSGDDERLWPYLILEHSGCGTLADVQASKVLPYSIKKQLCVDVASGLDAVHFSNIIHGDIKSENVLIFDKEGGELIAKLSDFGFATLDLDFRKALDGKKMSIHEPRAKAYLSSGTHPWTAPELGRVVEWAEAFSSDVYSWGLLVWRVHIDGQNPFTVYRTTFESLGQLTGFDQEGNVKNWKKANLVLSAARSWALDTPQAGYLINDVFEHSLGLQPTSRNLRKAFLPWMLGKRCDVEIEYSFKLPLCRTWIYRKIEFQRFQLYPPRLREQFLADLDKLARARSPLKEDEAHLCPTVMAGLTMAEFHISTNNCQSACMHIWMAASKGSIFAKAIATRLEPYDNISSNTDVIDVANYPSSIVTTLATRPVRTLMWAYESACSGSVAALQQLDSGNEAIYEKLYLSALETLRKCRLGGIQHLEMWSTADNMTSRETGIMQAAPTEREELQVQLLMKEGKLRLWVENGPRVMEEISALHVACAKGLNDTVRKLLAQGENVNSHQSPKRETPLLLATISGCLEIVRTLLSYGADPYLADDDAQIPLHFLSSFDEKDIPTAATLLCNSKIHLSAVAGSSRIFAEGDTLELGFGSGTPLHRAVGRRSIKAVAALLKLGADPLAKDCVGVTTLGFAARFHLVDILSLLHSSLPNYKPDSDHGPNLRLFNFAINGASPIDLFNIHGIRWRENTKVAIKLLLEWGENLYGYRGEDHFLRNAIAEGQDAIVEVLLENGATDYMEKFDHEFGGMPCLYNALYFGRRANFTSLLKHGASEKTLFVPSSVRQPGTRLFLDNRPDQSTYLHICSELGSDVFFVREFIRRGSPINQPDSEWHTALFLALKAGHHKIADELLEAGAMLDETLDGLTLLGQLATEGFGLPKARFQYLLDKTADNQSLKFLVSQRHRQSVFHLFAKDQRAIRQPAWARDLLEFFLDQVDDKSLLDLQDTDLNTAIHLAVKSDNFEIIRSLLEAGANPNLTNYEGNTPLALAMENSRRENKEIIALLEARTSKRLPPSTTSDNTEAAIKLWKTLGLPEYVDEWMDTALLGILQRLRSQLLDFFQSEDFLRVENPWTPVTRIVYDCVRTNTAILEKAHRTRDFEYGLSRMLSGFVDAVTIELRNKDREDNQLIIKLIKPLDRQTRQMPAGLLRPDILLPSYGPRIKATTYQLRGKEYGTPQQSKSISKPETHSSSSRGPWIRLRRLAEGRFIIEKHDWTDLDPSKTQGQDTGIMQMATDSSFARRGMIAQLKKEEVFYSVIDTTDSSSDRVATTVAQLASMTLSDVDESADSSAVWDEALESRSSRTSLSPEVRSPPQLPPSLFPAYDEKSKEPILSSSQKLRLKQLLAGCWTKKTVKRGDELASLLFSDPIPVGMLLDFNKLTTGKYVHTFPRPDSDHGLSAEDMTSKAVYYFTSVHRID